MVEAEAKGAAGRAGQVRLACSDALRAALRELLDRQGPGLATGDKALLKRCLESGDCTVEEIELVCKLRAASGQPSLAAAGLLGGLVWPKRPEPTPNPALERRREMLLARQAGREYAAGVANLRKAPTFSLGTGVGSATNGGKTTMSAIAEARAVMRDLSVGLAMILVCAGAFFAAKFLAESSGRSPDTGLIWGLLAGSGMLFVEMILFVIRSTRSEAFEREKAAFMAKQQAHNVSLFPAKRPPQARPKPQSAPAPQ